MRTITTFGIATVFLAASVHLVQGVDRIIAFADSYTDNGNDYANSKFPPSTYYKGRFSNGPTWLEYVAKELNSTDVINHGYGGATTNNDVVYSEFNNWTVPGLKQQIQQDTVENPKSEDDLYIVFIGYNDLNGIINPDQYHVVKNYTEIDVADNVIDGINSLIKKYKAKNFCVMTCPPFDRWPVVKDGDKPKAKKLIDSYNSNLNMKLKTVQNAEIKVLDDHAWFEKSLDNPEELGLKTDNGPCLPGIGATTGECSDPENHYFWDSYHPEAKAHKALGEWATKKFKEMYTF